MNCEKREVYTVLVDSSNTAVGSDASFTAYLPVTLKNVVRAELVSASVGPSGTPVVVYVHVQELISKFNTRASVKFGQAVNSATTTVGSLTTELSNTFAMSEAFVAIPVDTNRGAGKRVLFSAGSNFQAFTEYKEPIRQLGKLTVNLYDQYGGLLSTGTDGSFFVFRFECAKDNVCLY